MLKTPPPSKTSPLVDDDLDEEEAIREIEKKNLENVVEDETLEIDDIVNIKESRNHPLENVIGNLNQRTLRSQAQNQSNFFCFISTIEPKNVNEALGDESWIVAMQEELNQFIANDVWELVSQSKNMTIIGTKWVFRSKLDDNGIVSRNKARWSLDDLPYSVPTGGPYQTNPPFPDDIKLIVQIKQRGVVTRICYEQEIIVKDNQILTRKITDVMKTWVDIIRENVFCLGGNRDHVPACLCHMFFCIATSTQYNLAYFIAKRMKFVTKQAWLILPYGMLLTHLFEHVMSEDHELSNHLYVLCDRVMYPLATQQEQKTRKDYVTRRGRPSTSSSYVFGQPSSSHLNDDDNDGNDDGTSCTSTPSPTPSSSNPSKKIKLTIIPPRQLFVDLFSKEDDTTTPYTITKSSSPSPQNTPSKTPSTKDTSSTFGTTSSSFESKPQSSPPSSNDIHYPQPSNHFLNDILDAPLRPLNPPPP
ncbi:hypothetical protein Tco_1052293 [Tanacetum coccineum]